jgi:hypothetical protein
MVEMRGLEPRTPYMRSRETVSPRRLLHKRFRPVTLLSPHCSPRGALAQESIPSRSLLVPEIVRYAYIVVLHRPTFGVTSSHPGMCPVHVRPGRMEPK